MDDDYYLDACARMRNVCEKYGLTGARLAEQVEPEELETAYQQVLSEAGVTHDESFRLSFACWVQTAIDRERSAKRLRGSGQPEQAAALADAMAVAMLQRPGAASSSHEGPLPLPLAGARLRRGIRRMRMLRTAASENDRARVESLERDRWCGLIQQLFVEGEVPAVKTISECMDPARAMHGLVGKARASTLRGYVRLWEQWRRWMQMTRGYPWPQLAADAIDYLRQRADEPCGPSVPGAFLQACSFMEKAAGFEEENRISARRKVTAICESLTAQLGANARPVRRAPRFPVAILAALEMYVADESNPPYLRGVAWVRLVKVWATLRYDDHSWLSPETIIYQDGVLSATLTRTKTSGAARRVKELPMVISADCYVWEPAWIAEGFALWRSMANFERDYLLPRGAPDGYAVLRKPASYSDASSAGLVVLGELKNPITGESPFVDEELLGFWSEHSERATLPSGLAALQVEKSRRDVLGRWSPTGGDTYVRTYRAVVTNLQSQFAACARGGEAYKALDEGALGGEMKQWLMMTKDYDEEAAMKLITVAMHTFARTAEGLGQSGGTQTPTAAPLLSEDEESALADSLSLEPEAPSGGFIIVYTHRRRSARLHRVDGCWVARNYANLRDVEFYAKPNPVLYDAVCQRCYPDQAFTEPEGASGISETDSTSSQEPEAPQVEEL